MLLEGLRRRRGAERGGESCWFADLAPNRTILALEPLPANLRISKPLQTFGTMCWHCTAASEACIDVSTGIWDSTQSLARCCSMFRNLQLQHTTQHTRARSRSIDLTISLGLRMMARPRTSLRKLLHRWVCNRASPRRPLRCRGWRAGLARWCTARHQTRPASVHYREWAPVVQNSRWRTNCCVRWAIWRIRSQSNVGRQGIPQRALYTQGAASARLVDQRHACRKRIRRIAKMRALESLRR